MLLAVFSKVTKFLKLVTSSVFDECFFRVLGFMIHSVESVLTIVANVFYGLMRSNKTVRVFVVVEAEGVHSSCLPLLSG